MSLKDTYSEISEKKTSKLGYLILIALFIFIVSIGQTIFHDIQDIPNNPENPSYCASNYGDNLTNLTYKSRCYFSDTDVRYGIDDLIEGIDPTIEEIIDYNKAIKSKTNTLDDLDRDEFVQDYGLSLLEEIAEEEGVFDEEELQEELVELEETMADLQAEIANLEESRDDLIAKIQPQLDELDVAYDEALDYYETQKAWYSLKAFVLKLFFVLPFFGLFLWLYLKHKRKDSPYTIIITSVFFASVALFLEIVLIFLYDVLPKAWFMSIFDFLMAVAALKYIVYYGAVALVIVVLGGIVFFIQKNLYNPKRVALRCLKDNKCPSCSLSLKLSEKYCAKCGHQIKDMCEKCDHLKYVDLDHCPHCGENGEDLT
ncbi:hypothetical protein HN748_05355 [Candidatus Peregrinibacteria bacterium]|jgi:hypothetical protein|nr:hypothetical protein [Candidatus Peregrinibacteria bacterium]MBT7484036.1 hypothetical protein [Candidatus Peregrinibacteria bacterium]MBT7703635.1 hypothetical protein [Candidatus Peregrinibacteria bacterium]